MKVLFTVSECVPFIKSGGLADVAGSLPKELFSLGTDIRIMLPKYGQIPAIYKKQMKKIKEFSVPIGWRNQYCGIEELVLNGITFYFIDNEYYFNRDGLYGYYDDGERFSFFNKAVLDSLAHLDFFPDVIHCHDWHTAMIPFLLRVNYYQKERYGFIRTVFTIHNLQFQGIFPKEILTEFLGVSERYFQPDQLEFFGNVNFMKAGILAADKITTVSPTYCSEIQTEFFGEKLDGLLKMRNEDLIGILNGIDDDFYNPIKDPFLKFPFSIEKTANKKNCKAEVQKHFHLPIKNDTPLMVMITRLTAQKGLDLVKCVLNEVLQDDVQMIVLGTGDWEFEQFFQRMAMEHPEKLKTHIGFNEGLAHQLYAGADLFLMPSLFEPCGLGQLIAMKYGAIPIVRETGGLNDTVQAFNEHKIKGNGFSFQHFNAHDMLFTIRRAIQFYHQKSVWPHIVHAAMSKDYSWAQSAFKYNQLYAELISRSESHVF
ncbi:MAG TPA: glycogen synthase GlgA [Pseudoneobacillus sp.]|nr:glycogen synthase GlgA [Pseudoneobacillus sp.]